MNTPALDASVLESLRQLNQQGQPDIVREVLTVFLDDAPKRLAAIDQAVRSRNGQDIQRAAHSFKGAAGSIGASALQERCRELEDTGKAGALDGAAALKQQIHEEYERARFEIAEILATG